MNSTTPPSVQDLLTDSYPVLNSPLSIWADYHIRGLPLVITKTGERKRTWLMYLMLTKPYSFNPLDYHYFIRDTQVQKQEQTYIPIHYVNTMYHDFSMFKLNVTSMKSFDRKDRKYVLFELIIRRKLKEDDNKELMIKQHVLPFVSTPVNCTNRRQYKGVQLFDHESYPTTCSYYETYDVSKRLATVESDNISQKTGQLLYPGWVPFIYLQSPFTYIVPPTINDQMKTFQISVNTAFVPITPKID